MLLQLRDFIKKFQMASIEQLTREFSSDSNALEPMLEIWIAKGMIQKQEKKLACKTLCSSCSIKRPVYYHWVTSS